MTNISDALKAAKKALHGTKIQIVMTLKVSSSDIAEGLDNRGQ
jgi:hypothetical protein